MKKVKLQMQLSLDGFVGGPNGELDWMTWNWDDGLKSYVTDLTNSMDCILLGAHMPAGFIGHWESVAADPQDPNHAFGKIMCDTPKVVFTKTLEKSAWNNTVLAKGDLAEEVNRLKAGDGKDIIVYGGANFVSNMIKENLIDEYHLFINPVIIGNGLSIFNAVENRLNLKLVKATAFECGVTALHYHK
jgi:dihydrofolate reductase